MHILTNISRKQWKTDGQTDNEIWQTNYEIWSVNRITWETFSLKNHTQVWETEKKQRETEISLKYL